MVLNLGGGDEEDSLFGKRRGTAGFEQVRGRGRGWTAVVSAEGKGDYEDIQAAIDDLPYTHVGGRIYIDDGIYRLAEGIVIDRDNIELVFSGKAILKRKSDVLMKLISLGDGTTRREDITIRGLVIEDIGGSQRSYGLWLDKVSRIKFIDCRIENVHEQIVEVDADSNEVLFTGCHFDNNNTGAIINVDGDRVFIHNSRIIAALEVGGDDCKVTANHFTQVVSPTFTDAGSNRLIMIGNVFDDANGDADDDISFTGTNGTFIGNFMNDAANDFDYTGATTPVILDHDNIPSTFTTAAHTAIGNGAPHHAESHNAASHSDITKTGAQIDAAVTASHAQSHTVASHSDTTATGAELNTLTNSDDADDLHTHSRLSTSGESDAWWLDSVGNLRCGVFKAALVLPNMTTTSRNAIVTPRNGMLIYNTTVGGMQIYAGGWMNIEGE